MMPSGAQTVQTMAALPVLSMILPSVTTDWPMIQTKWIMYQLQPNAAGDGTDLVRWDNLSGRTAGNFGI